MDSAVWGVLTVLVKVKTDDELLTQQEGVGVGGWGHTDRKWTWLVSSFCADFVFPEGHTANDKNQRDSKTDWKPRYLTGGSSVHVPPQPVSYWSRDSQLVGGEVLRLLRVCRRKQSVIREELMWQNSQLSDECGVKSTIFPSEMWSSRSTSNRNTLNTRT